MKEFEMKCAEQQHWTEKIWRELNSIIEAQSSLERLLLSHNINVNVTESDTCGHNVATTKNISHDRETIKKSLKQQCSIRNQNRNHVSIPDEKRNDRTNSMDSPNDIIDWINSDISISSFQTPQSLVKAGTNTMEDIPPPEGQNQICNGKPVQERVPQNISTLKQKRLKACEPKAKKKSLKSNQTNQRQKHKKEGTQTNRNTKAQEALHNKHVKSVSYTDKSNHLGDKREESEKTLKSTGNLDDIRSQEIIERHNSFRRTCNKEPNKSHDNPLYNIISVSSCNKKQTSVKLQSSSDNRLQQSNLEPMHLNSSLKCKAFGKAVSLLQNIASSQEKLMDQIISSKQGHNQARHYSNHSIDSSSSCGYSSVLLQDNSSEISACTSKSSSSWKRYIDESINFNEEPVVGKDKPREINVAKSPQNRIADTQQQGQGQGQNIQTDRHFFEDENNCVQAIESTKSASSKDKNKLCNEYNCVQSQYYYNDKKFRKKERVFHPLLVRALEEEVEESNLALRETDELLNTRNDFPTQII